MECQLKHTQAFSSLAGESESHWLNLEQGLWVEIVNVFASNEYPPGRFLACMSPVSQKWRAFADILRVRLLNQNTSLIAIFNGVSKCSKKELDLEFKANTFPVVSAIPPVVAEFLHRHGASLRCLNLRLSVFTRKTLPLRHL